MKSMWSEETAWAKKSLMNVWIYVDEKIFYHIIGWYDGE